MGNFPNSERDGEGRFASKTPRRFVEACPTLPAWAARWTLDDPRGGPYLALWADSHGGEVLRVALLSPSTGGALMVAGQDGPPARLETIRRKLPRGGGEALFVLCPGCRSPRRALLLSRGGRYASRAWACRRCLGLTYSSQGAYLSSLARAFECGPPPAVFVGSGHAGPWLYSSPAAAVAAWPGLDLAGKPLRV